MKNLECITTSSLNNVTDFVTKEQSSPMTWSIIGHNDDVMVSISNLNSERMAVIAQDLNILYKKENFYITAIKNLRKKIRFMNLNFDYEREDITEQEFEDALEKNEDKYFIKVSLLRDNTDLQLIEEIAKKIDDELTVDDISEIFSIDISTYPNLIS